MKIHKNFYHQKINLIFKKLLILFSDLELIQIFKKKNILRK